MIQFKELTVENQMIVVCIQIYQSLTNVNITRHSVTENEQQGSTEATP